MKRTMKRIFFSVLLAIFMLNIVGMPKGTQTTTQVQAKTISGKVSSGILNIRDIKSTKGKKLTTLKKGKKVKILESGSKWVKVSVDGIVGYTQGKYIKTSHGTASKPYKNAISGKVTKTTLYVRAKKNSNSKCLLKIKKGQKIQVLTTGSKWVKVKVGDVIGYVKGKYVKTKHGTASNDSSIGSGKGAAVVAYAKRFLGNRYVYGGSSLTHGTDCSGFVMSIYRHFGKSLPHSSYALRHVGRAVKGGIKNAKPGDIICYSGHVAIYIGGNRIIHASNPKNGICIRNNASYRHIVAIRRIF